jgi:hypothetical protein
MVGPANDLNEYDPFRDDSTPSGMPSIAAVQTPRSTNPFVVNDEPIYDPFDENDAADADPFN